MIRLDHVTYAYPQTRTPVLRDIDLEIDAGSFVAVVGANGAGKSTLCAVLGGFIPHHYRGTLSGRVIVDGLDTATTPLSELVTHVGFVFQNALAQLTGARLTVEEEVAFGLENLGVPVAEMRRRVAATLRRVGLENLATRSPYSLSGGEMQRVALACILVMEPQVLVLDEPAAQLDPAGTRDLFGVLRELAIERSSTIVLVEQKTEWAAAMADRVIALDQGAVVLDGAPRAVLASPRMHEIGVQAPRYTLAAGRARERGLWPAGLDLPVTLGQAVAGFSQVAQVELAHPAGRGRAGPVAVTASLDPARHQEVTLQHPNAAARGARGISLRLRDLHYDYGAGVEALAGISLDIRPGEHVAVVGQNGSGKTTMAKHLNGLLLPARGEVEIGEWNTRTHSVAELSRRVGFVFQNPDDQIFSRRVADEVAFGLRFLALAPDEIERRVAAALERAGLNGLQDVHPYELLFTQRKWVALASVLVMDTPVLVLDEPTSGQDAHGLARWSRLLHELDDITVVAITHDVDWCAEQFDRVVAMHAGRAVMDGPAREVLGNSELTVKARLDPPQITRLGQALGVPGVTTVDEYLDALTSREEST